MPNKPQEPILNQLKELIKNKEYKSARELLEKSKELPQNIIYFNQGYIAYEQGDLVAAKKFYELAQVNGMLGPEVFASLKRVNKELATTSLESQYSTYENFLVSYKALPEPHLFLIYGFLLATLLGGFVKRWLPATALSLILLGTLTYHHISLEDLELVYVKSDRLIQRGPSQIFEETGVLPAGAKILYGKERNQWRYIKYPKVLRGWVDQTKELGQ